MAAMTSFHEKA